jgi:hypothetical protein
MSVLDYFNKPETKFPLLERSYREGNNKSALIDVIALAWLGGVEVPAWAREAVVTAYFLNTPNSWDDLFGTPFRKGAKTTLLRKLDRIRLKVFRRVKELNAQGEPIGDELFAKVGKEFGVSGQTVKNSIYYDKDTQIAHAIVDLIDGIAEGRDELWVKRDERRVQNLSDEHIANLRKKSSKKRR